MGKTSKPVEKVNRNVIKDLFMSILRFDIWLFMNIEYYISKGIHFLKPILEFVFIMSIGAGLLLIYGSLYVLNNEDFDSNINYFRSKYSRGEFLSISDTSESYKSLIQKELMRLKRKSHNLEVSLQKMNLELQTLCKYRQANHEVLPDFASEAVGGSIVSTPNTDNFYAPSFQATLFGIPIWKPNYHTPRSILQPWSEAGECWAFSGSQGSVIVELAQLALVDRVTLEHIPVSASLSGSITSAPKEFRVLGEFRNKYVLLGVYMYDNNGPVIQIFEVTKQDMKKVPFKLIMLQISTNWGNPDYTCIYRFKVHGKIYNHTDDSTVKPNSNTNNDDNNKDSI